MRQSTKTLFVVVAGWLVVTAVVSLVLLSTQGTFWIASHDPNLANIVWPMLGVIFVSGVTLMTAVHAYMRLLLGDDLEEET